MPTLCKVGIADRIAGSSSVFIVSSPSSYALILTNKAPTVPVGTFRPSGRVMTGKVPAAVPRVLLLVSCKALVDILMDKRLRDALNKFR